MRTFEEWWHERGRYLVLEQGGDLEECKPLLRVAWEAASTVDPDADAPDDEERKAG